MSDISKADSPAPRPVRSSLSDAEMQAILDSAGSVDPVEQAKVDTVWADGMTFPGGTPPAVAVAALRARRVGERGPQLAPVKKQISFRIRPAVLEAWRATGPGWMGRMEEYLATAPFVNLPPPITSVSLGAGGGPFPKSAAIRNRHLIESYQRGQAALDRQAEDEA